MHDTVQLLDAESAETVEFFRSLLRAVSSRYAWRKLESARTHLMRTRMKTVPRVSLD